MRSGFTIVRNGVQFDYPFRESLRSLAPLVDEIVVAHGDSSDSTLAELEGLRAELARSYCELRIVDSPWDPELRKGGQELARQTNIALSHCRNEICLYLQGDEVLHDEDRSTLDRDLLRLKNDPTLDGLAFAWVHFYGNYETEVRSRRWYRREVRAIKKSHGLQSYADAQGFRIPDEGGGWRKPRVALSAARVLHYGWVRPPQVMAAKTEAFEKLWGVEKKTYDPERILPPLFGMRPWRHTHPLVMKERIANAGHFDPFAKGHPERNREYWKSLTTSWIEGATNWRPGEFRNYEIVADYRTSNS